MDYCTSLPACNQRMSLSSVHASQITPAAPRKYETGLAYPCSFPPGLRSIIISSLAYVNCICEQDQTGVYAASHLIDKPIGPFSATRGLRQQGVLLHAYDNAACKET
ncbi:uncharacterized protein CTRU02_215605 [Colletotrichum truncatum]|uniref:Uncharacterized protein n=1 Tax=Colletotrichum truncatum TaxID=5467 RepID=A0ACC3YC52_COLTU|nr:uncharacterized protein CTRU02_05455 [Colletotrichum truncatum]KAF6793898.1 hypothetical protein CTRU02_05455 [Colletotrichum truncatum]